MQTVNTWNSSNSDFMGNLACILVMVFSPYHDSFIRTLHIKMECDKWQQGQH